MNTRKGWIKGSCYRYRKAAAPGGYCTKEYAIFNRSVTMRCREVVWRKVKPKAKARKKK